MRILLVEDDEDQRMLVRLVLEGEGHAVVEAATGEEALERFAGADCVLLDLRLPGIDGFEVLRRLPKPLPMPVVAMSAHAGADMQRKAREMGCTSSLIKPFESAALVRMLADLERRSGRSGTSGAETRGEAG